MAIYRVTVRIARPAGVTTVRRSDDGGLTLQVRRGKTGLRLRDCYSSVTSSPANLIDHGEIVNRLTGILLLAALVTLARPAAGQGGGPAESDRKGLFVYNLMLFVNWPAEAFQSPSEAIRVQIIGRDPFDGSFDRLLSGKTVHQRRIAVTHVAAPSTTQLPHLLFVSSAEEPRLVKVLAAYCRAPVLTVSDLDRFANRGGVIGVVEENHALRFVINQTAAREARLQVSAQLFHLAVPLFSAVSPCRTR
jgi:hypothetical protein